MVDKKTQISEIVRQRIKPKIWDYNYLLLKNNLQTFNFFREMLIKEGKKKILDVGCGEKPWKLILPKEIEYIGIDIDPKVKPDFIASADNLPFEDNYFDALIYSEVLEHTFNLDTVLKEMIRVSKNGALVYISSPFLFPLHGIPEDYFRLTKFFYQKIFQSHEVLVISDACFKPSTLFVIFNLFLETSIPYRFRHIFIPVKIIFNLFALISESIFRRIYKITPAKYKYYFDSMPIGYSLVVRIKK